MDFSKYQAVETEIKPVQALEDAKPDFAVQTAAEAPLARVVGSRYVRDLRTAFLETMDYLDQDTQSNYPGQYQNWLHWFASENPAEYFRGLTKLLPRQVAVSAVSTVLTAEDIAAMRERIETARASLLTPPAEPPAPSGEPMDISAEVVKSP